MPVEIEGVQGYEYQYFATIYLALLYIENDNVRVFVEDTEDAKIIFDKNDTQYDIYLQVKKHNEQISFENLSEWLAHFGNRQADKFLLSNIANNINSFSVFVSNGRCMDKISKFIRNNNFDQLNGQSFSREYLNDLKQEMQSLFNGKTGISADREKCMQNFFDLVTNDQVKNALQRISIVENLDFTNLKEKISGILSKRFVIRVSDVEHAIELLDSCIREGRDNKNDVVPEIKDILLKYSQKILPYDNNYIEYPDQFIYEEELEKNNVLLLTGVPFCGKTYVAKSVAQKYAQKGYEVFQTNEFNGDHGANSFLNSYANDQRLLLLEDPFGSIELKDNKAELLELIRKLVVEKVAGNRKIIVTSRNDIVMALFERKSLNECNINQFNWKNQTLSNLCFAKEFWCKLYGNSLESQQCFEKIQKWIVQNESGIFLEIGEINSLYKQYPKISYLLENDLNTIIKSARISSKVVIEKIVSCSQDEIYAFISLGLSCGTIRSVSVNELAYVLSDSEVQPAIIEKSNSFRSVTLGGKDDIDEPEFPSYNKIYKIDDKYAAIFSEFERLGYIFRDRLSNQIQFTHPIFYFASKLLCLKELNDTWDNSIILKLATHALGTLNKSVNLSALETLGFCYSQRCAGRHDVLELLFSALNSIFPATKDKVILLLEMYFNDFTQDYKEKLVNAIDKYEFDEYVLWHNNEPWLNLNDEIYSKCDLDYWIGTESPLSLDEIKSLDWKKHKISSKMIYDILQSRIKDDLPIDILNYALFYDETIIREKAIYLIFKNHAFKIGKLSEYLLDFDNYNVIFKLFRGALDSWLLYEEVQRNLILNYFKSHLNRISVSIRAKKFLETFGDDYHSESLNWNSYDENQKKILWKLWCEVFSEFLFKFPAEFISMNEAHMEYEMGQVIHYINDQKIMLNLIKAWVYWLENYIKYHRPDDYGMSVMSMFLKCTNRGNIEWNDMFKEMLNCQNTNIITSHLKHAIDNWSLLGKEEKGILLSLLVSNRIDVIWLRAVSLTRESTPKEVQSSIFGDEIFSKTICEIVKALRKHEILEECINVYCGFPQPLWWNGYHHSNCELWDRIIAEVLQDEIIDKAFEISLREFIDCQYNYRPRFKKTCQNIWESLLTNNEKRKKTFRELLYVTVSQVQTNKSLWDKYWDKATPKEKESDYDNLASVVELIELYQRGESGILDIFEMDIVFKQLYPRLKSDNLVKKLCYISWQYYVGTKDFLAEESQPKEIEKAKTIFEKGIKLLYKNDPPRMRLTNLIVKNTMDKLEVKSEEILQLLEKRRNESIEATDKLRKMFDDDYKLKNWNE